jgi:hypothetical protein
MAHSYNKHGQMTGGWDHVFHNRTARMKTRIGIAEIMKDNDDVVFPNKNYESGDVWNDQADGMTFPVYVDRIRSEVYEEIHSILNHRRFWYGNDFEENIAFLKIHHHSKWSWLGWLDYPPIRDYLCNAKDPLEALENIPIEYVEGYVQKEFKHLLRK